MNRNITNTIRFLMDECLPPFIRDSKWFMYPFYYYAYRGKNIKQVMDFKKLVYEFSPEEYDRFYSNLDTISRNRLTDLNKPSLDFILRHISSDSKNAIDVGCGKGYLLEQIKKAHPKLDLHGFDIKNFGAAEHYTFTKGNIENLPFADKSFDVVTCSHTLEHIIDLPAAIKELKRIARKQLFVVVPCQRFFYYTLDEHVNFFPYEEKLTSVMGMEKFECHKLWGDWVFVGYPDK